MSTIICHRPKILIANIQLCVGLIILLSLCIGGCGPTRLAIHAAKEATRSSEYMDDKLRRANPKLSSQGGVYKVGNPYQIDGIWYYPREEPYYKETGIASWYGKPFHGEKTANGETYDMNALTAAHKTLPMPSYVRVTNLENGRAITVRVNDRGPFVHGRIIDMSNRAAQLLRFKDKGTAKVLVELVGSPNESRVAIKPRTPDDARYAVKAAPLGVVQTTILAPLKGVRQAPFPKKIALPDKNVKVMAVEPSALFIQTGAFAFLKNAHNLEKRLPETLKTEISSTEINGQKLYRVRVGPIQELEEADNLLAALIRTGFIDARIVVD